MKNDTWINTYESLMFDKPESFEMVQRAQNIKYENMPKSLFKYRDANNLHHIDSLRYNNLFFALPEKMHGDPGESRILLDLELAHKKIINKVYSNLRNDYPYFPDIEIENEKEFIDVTSEATRIHSGSQNYLPTEIKEFFSNFIFESANKLFEEQIYKFKNMYSICCLSDSHDNDYMWEKYANDYSGFCVEYDVKGIGPNSNIAIFTLPIIYRDSDYPIFDYEVFRGMTDRQAGSFGMHALSIKPTSFAKEHEWRIFQLQRPDNYSVNMPPVLRVYLGKNISDENARLITSICMENNIETFLM